VSGLQSFVLGQCALQNNTAPLAIIYGLSGTPEVDSAKQTDELIMKHVDSLDMCLKGNQLNSALCAMNEYHSTQISRFVLQRVSGSFHVDKSDLDKFAAKVILDTFLEFLHDV
jgi:RNase H-fold protein (predicted Holliday junction resolvase)